jgi:hypothetical protein
MCSKVYEKGVTGTTGAKKECDGTRIRKARHTHGVGKVRTEGIEGIRGSAGEAASEPRRDRIPTA